MYYKSYVALSLIIFANYFENVNSMRRYDNQIIQFEKPEKVLAKKNNLKMKIIREGQESYKRNLIESSINQSSNDTTPYNPYKPKSQNFINRQKAFNNSIKINQSLPEEDVVNVNGHKRYIESAQEDYGDIDSVDTSKSMESQPQELYQLPSTYRNIEDFSPPYAENVSNEVRAQGSNYFSPPYGVSNEVIKPQAPEDDLVSVQKDYSNINFDFPNSKQNLAYISASTDQGIKIINILNNIVKRLNDVSRDVKNIQNLFDNLYDFKDAEGLLIKTFSNLKTVSLTLQKGSFPKNIQNVFISMNDNNARLREFCQYFLNFNSEHFADRAYLTTVMKILNAQGYVSIYKIKEALDEIIININNVKLLDNYNVPSDKVTPLFCDLRKYLNETKYNWDEFFKVMNDSLNLVEGNQKISKSVINIKNSSSSIKTEIMRTFNLGNDIFNLFSDAQKYLKNAKSTSDKLENYIKKYKKNVKVLPNDLIPALEVFSNIKKSSLELYDAISTLKAHKSIDKLNQLSLTSLSQLNEIWNRPEEKTLNLLIHALGATGLQLLDSIVNDYASASKIVSNINTQSSYNNEISEQLFNIIESIKTNAKDIAIFYQALRKNEKAYDEEMVAVTSKSARATKDDIVSGFSADVFANFRNVKLALLNASQAAKNLQNIANKNDVGVIKRYKDEDPNASKIKNFLNKAKKKIVSTLHVEYENYIVNYFHNAIKLFEALEKPLTANEIEKRFNVFNESFKKVSNFYEEAKQNRKKLNSANSYLNNINTYFSEIEELLEDKKNPQGFRTKVSSMVDKSIITLLEHINTFKSTFFASNNLN